MGYSGLGAGVHDSGKEHIEKRITKSGRKELRWAMVEAAWRAIRISPYWKEQYEKYLRRMRKPNQAIVVIARKVAGGGLARADEGRNGRACERRRPGVQDAGVGVGLWMRMSAWA